MLANPNPAQNFIEFNFNSESEAGNTWIEIRDLLGRIVLQKVNLSSGKNSVSTHELKAGTYLVNFYSSGKTGHKKLIINR